GVCPSPGYPYRSCTAAFIPLINSPMQRIYRISSWTLFLAAGLFLLGACRTSRPAGASSPVPWKKVRVMVYTKNGQGYVHDNIPSAVACIQRLGRQYGFGV